MSKDIKTLVADMEAVVSGEGNWDGHIGSAMGKNIALLSNQRFSEPQKPRS